MIDIFKLYQKFLGEVNSHQGGFVRPNRNFTNWVNDISLELFREMFKDWEKNQRITDEVGGPFLKSISVNLSTQAGKPYDFFVPPPEYEYYSSAYIIVPKNSSVGVAKEGTQCMDGRTGKMKKFEDPDNVLLDTQAQGSDKEEVSITKVDNSRWAAVTSHKFKSPTITKPFMTQVDGGFKVAPKSVGVIVLNYFRKPKPAIFNYTVGPDDQIIYAPAGSQNLEWSETMINEFLIRLKKKYGAYTGNEAMYSMGRAEQKDGA